MDAIKAMLTRRSVREFSDKKVPKELTMKILETGIYAPSSKNSQPWYFVADSTEKKNKIADLIEEKANPNFTPMDPRTGKPAVETTALLSARVLRNAPVIILVFSESPFVGGRINILKNPEMKYLLSYESEIESVAAAVQNMLLAAHSLGLGGLWTNDTYYIAKEIQELYNQKGDLITILCLGYPKADINRDKIRLKKYEFA